MAIQQKLKEENTTAEPSSSNDKEIHSQYPFYIHDQYVKDLSFENPNFLIKYSEKSVKPDVSVNVSSNVSKLNDDTYEVVLKVNVKSTLEEKTVFLLDLSYGALVSVDKKQPNEVLEPALLVHAPFLMFPFVREIVANSTKNGGYPPLLLEPIDFASLYVEKKREAIEKSSNKTGEDISASNKKPTVN